MKELIKSAINTVLSPPGLAIVSKDTISRSYRWQVIEHQLRGFLTNIQESLTGSCLPDLSTKDNRIDLIIDNLNLSLQPFFLINFLKQTINVPGDVCEFGCAHGASTALFANEILETEKHLWIYDSFEGLPKPTDKDILIDDIANLGSIDKYQGEMAHPKEQVLTKLSKVGFPVSRTHVIPGFIEQTSKTGSFPERISFAYIDFDFYEPIKIGLELIKSRIHKDGIIMVDDYGYFSAGAKTAVDEFIAEQNGKFVLEPIPKWGGKCIVVRPNF